ncbi:hypothetical protein K2173_005538 [Erythroxylum novogranatense]|uniref:DYW domain-containing protein n=1 Tax=Erythroxylum novogranatense TaxID=1862640 RepID=A0AAV8SKS7_9ROSI|nr:hypothetical protein K2173_005538 [Erythroxylum novogranatense]
MQRLGLKRLATQTPVAVTAQALSSNALVPSTSSSLSDDDTDPEVFCHLLEACKLSLDLRTAVETHAKIIRFGYGTDPSLAAHLISSYVRCDRLRLGCNVVAQVGSWTTGLVAVNKIVRNLLNGGEYGIAKRVFDKMPNRDVVTWNSVIGGYVTNSRYDEALRLFRKMLSSNVEPDGFTFASAMSACAKLGAPNYAQWVHQLLVEKRIVLNHILSAALIYMYASCGRIQAAKDMFYSVPRIDVSIWNSMIKGLAVHGLAFDAIEVFSKMEMENVLPDSITFLGILTACSHCGMVTEGGQYFDLMRFRYSIRPQLEHYGAMVDLFGRAGLMEEAYAMIKAMPMEPDAIIWRALLSACRTHKWAELGKFAIENISRLRSGDFVLLSNIYCSQSRWECAQEVRETMKKKGVHKVQGKSWFEWAGKIHQFIAGDKSHPESEAMYKVLEGLMKRTKLEGFVPATDLVMMDVSEEEKEENLYHHSEKLALAYGILKTSPGTEIRISKNLRVCYDCHNWIKMISRMLNRVIIIRDRIRFHQFEGGSCSCADYW